MDFKVDDVISPISDETQDKSLPQFGGEVTSPKIMIKDSSYKRARKYIYDPHGLFSEVIFGPTKDYTCSCGNFTPLTRALNEGKTCPRCGVKCISSKSRLTTFGYIALPLYVVKTSKLSIITSTIAKFPKEMLSPKTVNVLKNQKLFLAFDGNKNKISFVDGIVYSKDILIIPLKITGVFTFTCALKTLDLVLNAMHHGCIEILSDVITKKILVIPPDTHKIAMVKNEMKPSKITRCYMTILSMNQYFRSKNMYEFFDYVESDIINNTINMLNYNQSLNETDPSYYENNYVYEEDLFSYDRFSAAYQQRIDELYSHILQQICGKEGIIRQNILGKNIDFSARGVIVVDPSIEAYKIKVGYNILYKLWLPYMLNYLYETKKDTEFVTDIYHNIVNNWQNNDQSYSTFREFIDHWYKKKDQSMQHDQSFKVEIKDDRAAAMRKREKKKSQ